MKELIASVLLCLTAWAHALDVSEDLKKGLLALAR